MLLMDSLTRMANAQREIGLSVGEPPATKGFPPSVFAVMPRLLERAGCGRRGSITGIYTVLVDADDINEPISDAARSVLDGHIWLSRDLAVRAHYPAIDVMNSVIRLMVAVVPQDHLDAAYRLRSILAKHRDTEDMINIGAYAKGSNPEIVRAIRMSPMLTTFLRQGIREKATLQDAREGLFKLVEASREREAANDAPKV